MEYITENQPTNSQNISENQPNSSLNDIQMMSENGQNDVQNLHQETQREHKPTPQESFQELRQRAEQAERERNEALGFIRQLEQMAYQQQVQTQHHAEPVPEQSSYSDDDIIEGRHLKAEFSHLKKELEAQRRYMEEARKMAEVNSVENKLRTKYNDFDSVVTYENIQKLRELKPEIAASLHQTQDLFNKAAATYTILKDLGIARSQTFNDDHIKAQNNLNKPKAASSIAPASQLAHASSFSGDLTEDRKRQIWEQMQQNARRR